MICIFSLKFKMKYTKEKLKLPLFLTIML